ncbi:hypothetical protein BU111_12290 [Staphylococcus xylosus]|nr:hypothetical protein BU099_08520 [Staphylococcus xylosus]PTI49201.1 hypothetical protein BU111_12290 [Staphylococcus xylosus]PTI54422.1 hypothetical protein BU106_05085 [Staphylococcus xylosus]
MLLLIIVNFFLPIIGTWLQIEVIKLGSIYIKILDTITIIVATVFMYRQIKQKVFFKLLIFMLIELFKFSY